MAEGGEYAGDRGGSVGRVGPQPPEGEQRFLLEGEERVGVVGAVVVVVPYRVGGDPAEHLLQIGVVSGDQVAVGHPFQGVPVSLGACGSEVALGAVAHDEVGVVPHKDGHVGTLAGDGLVDAARTVHRELAAGAESHPDLAGLGRGRGGPHLQFHRLLRIVATPDRKAGTVAGPGIQIPEVDDLESAAQSPRCGPAGGRSGPGAARRRLRSRPWPAARRGTSSSSTWPIMGPDWIR